MNANSLPKVKIAAIAANLAALNDLLTNAAGRSAHAHRFAQGGDCNSAIGAVLDLNSILDDAKSAIQRCSCAPPHEGILRRHKEGGSASDIRMGTAPYRL